MEKITNQERLDLEQVFSAIYVENSKFINFYRFFYANFFNEIKKLKLRLRRKKSKI